MKNNKNMQDIVTIDHVLTDNLYNALGIMA